MNFELTLRSEACTSIKGEEMQNINKSLSIISAGFILVLCLTLLVPSAESKASEKKVKIGALMPLSGVLSPYGQATQKAILLAAQQINQAGGILDKEVEIVTRDSKTDTTSGVDAAKKLILIDKVVAIAGPMHSEIAMAVAEGVSVHRKVVTISPSATSPQLTECNDEDYLFRTCPSDSLQGVILGQFALDQGYESLSFIYVNNSYGKGLADATGDWFEQDGREVLAKIPYATGKTSYQGEIRQATKGDPDSVALIGYPENGVKILRQAVSGGYTGKFLFPDGMRDPSIVENVGTQFLNGTYGTNPGSKKTPSKVTFNQTYKEEYGSLPPKPFMPNGYDATVVISLALEKAGSVDSVAIRDNLRSIANPPGEKIYAGVDEFKEALQLLEQGKEINYEGAGGSVDFNKDGDVVSPINVWKIEDGQIVTVRTEDVKVRDGRFVPAKTIEEE